MNNKIVTIKTKSSRILRMTQKTKLFVLLNLPFRFTHVQFSQTSFHF